MEQREQQREQQYANIELSRQNYRLARDQYEPLPQTPREEELWNEFVPAWNSWEEINNTFLRGSRQIEQTGVLNTDEYVGSVALSP